MGDNSYDVIVVGAGMAGVACAGELALHGARPLLICETAEVGHNFRSVWVDGNRCILQHPTNQLGWGGGWWSPLVRALNVPIRIHPGFDGIEVSVWGTGAIHKITPWVSAATMVEQFCQFSPFPLDDVRGELERVMHAALAIPHEELVRMDRLPLAQWLADQGADEMVSFLVLTFCGQIATLTTEDAREHLSTFGGLGLLRSGPFCGEGQFVVTEPDAQEGLCVPIAKEVERRGGAVWRGRRVAHVLIEDGRAAGVELADGTEVRAPAVAIACGNPRIGSLFEHLPPEVEEVLSYSLPLEQRDFCTIAVLDQPVLPPERRSWFAVMSPGEHPQWSWPIHVASPWGVKPGKQVVTGYKVVPSKTVADLGGEQAIFDRLHDVHEAYFPGYKAAIGASATISGRHLWLSQVTVGPKFPRSIDSVRDLWFVGDGSAPIAGVFVEAAASAGILGARAIAGRENARR